MESAHYHPKGKHKQAVFIGKARIIISLYQYHDGITWIFLDICSRNLISGFYELFLSLFPGQG